jgi:hypothetical protein
MKVTLGEIKNSEGALSTLLNKPLPVGLSYQLSKLVPVINNELQLIEETRLKLVAKYADKKKDADGNLKVAEKNLPKFYNEIGELYRTETEIPIQPIQVNKLGNVTLSAVEIDSLKWLLR